MKKLCLYLLLLLISASHYACSKNNEQPIAKPKPNATNDTLRIATYNLRMATTADIGDKNWSTRKQYVGKIINDYKFDVFGVQEVTDQAQQNDLMAYLPEHFCFAKGRNNTAGTSGERIGIVYRKTRFEVKESGFFFLSPTPDVAGIGWDAAHNRIAVWILFYDKNTKKNFYFFNIHLDNKGATSRRESAKLVAARMQQMAGTNPVFCTGDFNATSQETDTYSTMTTHYNDSRVVSQTPPTGFVGTYNGFDVAAADFGESARIDFIFTNSAVHSYAVIGDKFVEGSYPSDHFPVMIKVVMK